MNKSLLLFLFASVFLLSACLAIPGGDTHEHFHSVHHTGIAVVSRLFTENNKPYLDFSWQADNNLGPPTNVTNVAVSDIAEMDISYELKVGEKLSLEVTHFYQQRGSTTPELLESLWLYKNPAINNESYLLKIGNMKRPPRCPNQ